LAIGLSLLFPRGSVLFVLLAILATYQRLYSGSHFPSDTVAGFGIACLACSLVLCVPRLRKSF
jgi:membrane-associated phospholipid phosphatase